VLEFNEFGSVVIKVLLFMLIAVKDDLEIFSNVKHHESSGLAGGQL
jgi:hypothetical protein